MKSFTFVAFLNIFILFILFNPSILDERIYPDKFIKEDLIFPENDKTDDYQYNLVDAKVLTKELITLYIKRQGINLDKDDCCLDSSFEPHNAWTVNGMEGVSDLEEIYSNAVYKVNANILTYNFPVPTIQNIGYTLYHKVRIFDIGNGSPNCKIYFNDKEQNSESGYININLSGGKLFVILEITYNNITKKTTVEYNGQKITLDPTFTMSTINFKFPGKTYSPAVAFHWTYYKIQLGGIVNFSLKGSGLCSITNPCLKGYVCVGGLCERCHASCYDCKNGGLSTDCDTKCSVHSSRLTPDRGSCPFGYVDLSQFDSFTLQGIVPPPRNNRWTISFWIYLTSFPQNKINNPDLTDVKNLLNTNLSNSYDDDLNFTFYFSNDFFRIRCGPKKTEGLTALNTWYFVKCASSPGNTLYVQYFDINENNFQYIYKDPGTTNYGSGTNCIGYVYFEPDDYITFWFEGYNSLYNNDIPFNFYIKQFIIFREYLQEPYDNKYFSFEKIFTSNFELPEVMFIIPFDELIRNDNKYDIKCYSYSGSILENRITLTPYYYEKNYTLYPSKLFRRLNLLERNKKYISHDLVKTGDVLRDNNTLIASYDYSPITCIDKYFLSFNNNENNDINYFGKDIIYTGKCTFDCDKYYSSMRGLSENKGFCNYKCFNGGTRGPKCLSNNHDLLNLRSNFECNSGYFEIFNNCDERNDDIEKDNVFLFDHDNGPANIVMDVINYNLKSYIIEFWMFLSECSEAPTTRYILFYTNQFIMRYNNIDIKYFVDTTPNRIETEIDFDRSKWNHFAFEVFYDPKELYDRKSVITLQQHLNSGNTIELDHTENIIPLEYIYFCNGRRASCNNIAMTWYCAYYKNLRLFNGNLAHRYITFRYDEYYWDYKYLLSSIKLYYPLYGHYIANNLLSQYNSKDSALNTNSATNNWNFPQYLYCRKVDPLCSGIVNCENCFNGNQCYKCTNKEDYFLHKIKGGEKIECKDLKDTDDEKSYFVLRLPSQANFELKPLEGYPHPGATVTFYIKIYGFTTSGKIDVIYLGDNIKISYYSDLDSANFGLNLVTFKDLSESTETVVSNYYDFRKHFGVWTYISVSSYDKTYENFYPPMVRFEINNKKMPIIGPLDNLSIGTIRFSNELFALVQRLKVYGTYLIGTNTFEIHKENLTYIQFLNDNYLRPLTKGITYFEPVKTKSECLFERFKIIATDKENPDKIIDNYECVPDYNEDLLITNIDNQSLFYNYTSESTAKEDSCYKKYMFCNGNTIYNYSCNFENNDTKIFLGNITNHFCTNLSYVNFAKAKDITIKDVQTGGYKFTLHFWVFAYSYVDKVFQGLSVDWKYHTTIELRIDSTGKYIFTCLINGEETRKYVDFIMNEWNFLHCSVNYDDSKFYITSENRAYEYGFTYINKPPEIALGQTTTLTIKDLTNVKDWGYLFYRYIRLWKNIFRSSSFLSRINIRDNYFDSYLLYQWENLDNTNNPEHRVKSTKYTSKHIYVEYSTEKIGTNIVPQSIYEDAVAFQKYFCNENMQFYDRKTKSCINFIDISYIKDDNITFTNIDVAYSHNYGMAFWILLEDHKDINSSLNFIWQYHMQISLQYVGNTFKAYCFPQNYEPYSAILRDKSLTLDQQTQIILNSATNEYTEDLSGVWTWFQCSLSYNNRYFYLNENEQTLIAETLYKEGNIEYKNDEPLGFFYNNIESSLSTLNIQTTGNRDHNPHKKIYLRCFYLFKDFLPYNYDFKYMDMSKIGGKQFPPLTFVMNFANFKYNPSWDHVDIKYNNYSSLDNELIESQITIYYKDKAHRELAANFIFLPLCNPLTKEKYNFETQLCQEIQDCDTTALKCLYCMEEKTPLICKKNYYLNFDPNDNSVYCSNYCEDGNFFRSPGTLESQGICGTKCLSLDVLKTCPNSASSILTYQNDFECKAGYYRIGYQCFKEPTNTLPNPGALFYSGVNYPYNIFLKLGEETVLQTEIEKGYALEFWFMIDNVIYKDFKEDEKYNYFYAYPHEIYLIVKKQSDNSLKKFYYYRYIPRANDEHDITDLIDQYEWNKILIFVETEKRSIIVYVNFNKRERKILTGNSGELKLENILFCTKRSITLNYPDCISKGTVIYWASAYYNNIRVWNILTSTIDTIQSFLNKIYTEYPQSLVLFYPLTIKYIDNNQMTNLMENYELHISFRCVSGTACTLYNKDNIIIYNYSSKFDWGILHKKQFVSNMEENLYIDPNDIRNKCNEHCVRCYDTDNIEECYECETGYVLQYKECKDARKLYFLKVPSGTAGAPIYFKTLNKENKDFCNLISFTIVFWMKFFGVKYPTVTEYCKIFSIDSNTYLSYHRASNNLVLRENSKSAFIDDKFRSYFGVWIPIAIANYISNTKNDVYPNMLTLSVNKIDIPFAPGYRIPASGIKATELSFGYEIIALFAELSIYSKFIQGAYGRIRSEQVLTDRFFYLSLTGTKPNDCLVVDNDLLASIDLICAPDYSVHFIDSYYCKDDEKFYDPYDDENNERDNADKCRQCNDLCLTLCYNETEQNCTCDMTDGIYWLRKTGTQFDQTYCEHIYYLDFSTIEPYIYYNTPITKTKEYTIEFWLYVYSYNRNEKQFKEMYLEWNFHNRIRLYDENQNLKYDCQPIWRSFDFETTTYSDVRTNTLVYAGWNYVRCGTDLKNRKYFSFTNIEYDIKAKKDTFFNFDEIESSTASSLKFFKIYKCEDFNTNFGYVFIREIKLWQQYNIDYLDTKYIQFDMNKITKEEIKQKFPGLFLYYKNNFNLTIEGNSVIKEELSEKIAIITRSPDYVGYNIVYDPLTLDNEVCVFGEVYYPDLNKCDCPALFERNLGTGVCEPKDSEIDASCETYSNLYKQCLQCKDNNPFLNRWVEEFGEECYTDCPPTLYGDPLINQCRRCHETCYECTNEFYNNCTSCTGTLYFNFKENTCIPNCQTAELTRSLTKPNICVIFDASARLVNVDELIPIDINTFDFIEAEVILPTSPEYQTLWLFDANKTNFINRELGFTDDIPLDSEPFNGDKTKINTTLNHTFFKTEHLYVFGLKIYVENKGLEVAVYVWWTLTMNSPPYGGKLTVMPYLGLYNTTTFIIRCVDFEDENTPREELEYDFYYKEVNTNFERKLSNDFSLNNEVYSNFTVRYYQLEYSNITLYCKVRDKWGATTITSNMITIVNKKHSPLYVLKQLVASFYIVDDALTDIQLLARSEVLMSLGINPYTDRVPSSYFTTYEGSLTGERVLILEPQCVNGYCNDNGDCEVIDVALTCKCTASYIGKQCFLDKNGYADLASYYIKMFLRLQDRINSEPINDIVFTAFYRLFFAAQNFFQNDTFFQNDLIDFKNHLLNNELGYITETVDRLNKILDIDELFFNYFYVKETQTKLTTKINEGYEFRNKTLTDEESSNYQIAIDTFFTMIDEDTVFLIKNYGSDYTYTCQHFIYRLKKIDENFDDEEYFESLKTVLITYKPTIYFMNCLKQKYSSFNFYLNYIEYLVNPMSYDSNFYPNVTSPFVSIKIYDSNGKEIEIKDCNEPIKINMPFNAYDWISYINRQKWLFLPENYKLEDDPIFRDPILIWENGSVSDDTVEQRIAKYYRYYNIVGLVYTPNTTSLYEYTSFIFKNISDTFFLLFETNHLSAFSSMIIPNIMNFVVDGRFFYFKRYMVLVYYPNQISNPAFYIIISLLLVFVIICIIFKFKDYIYFDNLEDLVFLKKEIVKAKFDYNQYDPGLNDENIIKRIPQIDPNLKKNKKKQIATMFDEYDVEGNEVINEDSKENENDDYISNIMKNDKNVLQTLNSNGISTTGRTLVKKKINEDENENNGEEDEMEKVTEIKTKKSRQRKMRNNTNRSKSKKNPPKRKNKINDDDEDEEEKDNDFNRAITERDKRKKNKNKNKGYGDGEDDDDDFDEEKIEKNMTSDKSTIRNNNRYTRQNYDLQSLNSKLGFGFNLTKFSKVSKFSNNSKLSNQSKKSYYLNKDKTKVNYISLQKFHDHSKKVKIDEDITSKDKEKMNNLDEYTKLDVSPYQFFKYNLRTRHVLVAPFLNLTLFNNRWKKLMVLLTQFYLEQLVITVILTSNEKIIITNFVGMILTSLISVFAANIIVYCFVFLFSTDSYDRMRLYRLVMTGHDLFIFKAWSDLQRLMNIKIIFGIIIVVIFWILNFYTTLIFTAVWKVQRYPWVICFIMTLFIDLVIGEIGIESICTILFYYRKRFNCLRNLGNNLNNLRRYRTMYP